MEADLIINPEDVIRLQKEDPAKLKAALFRGMQAAMRVAESHAVSAVSGSVLKVETGLLKKSVHSEVRQLEHWTIGNLRIDKDAYYGRIWESGITGPVNVKKAYTRLIRKAFGKSINPVSANVKQHIRQIKEKARPFRTPAITAAEPVFATSFKQAIEESL